MRGTVLIKCYMRIEWKIRSRYPESFGATDSGTRGVRVQFSDIYAGWGGVVPGKFAI
jgi:hypothetical protein